MISRAVKVNFRAQTRTLGLHSPPSSQLRTTISFGFATVPVRNGALEALPYTYSFCFDFECGYGRQGGAPYRIEGVSTPRSRGIFPLAPGVVSRRGPSVACLPRRPTGTVCPVEMGLRWAAPLSSEMRGRESRRKDTDPKTPHQNPTQGHTDPNSRIPTQLHPRSAVTLGDAVLFQLRVGRKERCGSRRNPR